MKKTEGNRGEKSHYVNNKIRRALVTPNTREPNADKNEGNRMEERKKKQIVQEKREERKGKRGALGGFKVGEKRENGFLMEKWKGGKRARKNR